MKGGGVVSALVALIAGVAIGVAVNASGSDPMARAAESIEPIGTLWVNAIRMTVIPLVVATLIASTAATTAGVVGNMSARAFGIFLGLLALTAVVAVAISPPVFSLLSISRPAVDALREASGIVESPPLPSFSEWLTGLVPANPFRAAADGAMLPLVVFALLFGLALGRSSASSRSVVGGFFSGVAETMLVVVRWLVALAPIGVFVLALGTARRVGVQLVGAVGFYIVAYCGILIAVTVMLYVIAVFFGRVPLRRFARAAAPAQLVGAATRASLAALPAMLQSAEQTLRLSRVATSFGLPLAVSVFRLNQAVSWVVMALFAARLYGVDLSNAALLTLALTSIVTSFSVPGIPSASLFVVAPFFASVGIPPEAVGILLALDLIPDVFKTTLNVTSHLTSVAILDAWTPGNSGVKA